MFAGEIRRDLHDGEADERAKGDHGRKVEDATLLRFDANVHRIRIIGCFNADVVRQAQ